MRRDQVDEKAFLSELAREITVKKTSKKGSIWITFKADAGQGKCILRTKSAPNKRVTASAASQRASQHVRQNLIAVIKKDFAPLLKKTAVKAASNAKSSPAKKPTGANRESKRGGKKHGGKK